MATLAELQDALVNADKAGDKEAARQLADAIVEMQGENDAKPASVRAGSVLNDIPRQLGLTARYAMEGLGNSAQLFTEPIRYATDRLTGSTGKTVPAGVLASRGADWLGLPKPQGANERVVGEATKLVAGSGGIMGLAGAPVKLGARTFSTGIAPNMFSSNPLQQVSSAAGAGLAGGASKEAGGSDAGQAVAALVGGVVGGKAPDIAGGAAALAKRLFNAGMTQQQLDVKIGEVLRQTGVDYSQVPERVKQSLRLEMAGALDANKALNPAAVSRLLAFQEAGVTPTRGMISQNPVQITNEQNLAKIGANSADEGLSGLALIQNQNNARLIGNLNALGADRGNANRAGEVVTSSVLGRQAGLRGAETAAWDAAKTSPGYRQPISAHPLSDINAALGEQGMMPFMNPAISKYMEAFQNGQPFTPQDYRNLMSMLSRESAKGGNEGAAASLASRVLRQADLRPAGFVNSGNSPVTPSMAATIRGADNAAADSISAVNRAREATNAAYTYEESSPLVRSILSDARTSDPARIAKSYIIGGTAREAEDVISQVGPQNIGPIKDAVLNHLKEKAINKASDEVGKFSQSAFNKALRDIGDEKLALLFSQEELRALRVNGRVAALMQVQPVGSAVNNSNSGSMLLGRGIDWLNKVPVVGPMTGPALKNIQISYGNNQAQRIAPGLLADQEETPAWQKLMAPGAAIGGLLAAP